MKIFLSDTVRDVKQYVLARRDVSDEYSSVGELSAISTRCCVSRLELKVFSGKFLSYIIQSVTSKLANQRLGAGPVCDYYANKRNVLGISKENYFQVGTYLVWLSN